MIDYDSPGLFAASISNGKWRWADHLAELDQVLKQAAETPDSRVLIEAPPRHGKSFLTSLYFPAWYRLKYPRRNIMLWSATGRLAQRFSTQVRNLVSPLVALDESTQSWEHWKLLGTAPNEGEFFAAGVGGGGTMGAGGHLLIVDDYFKDLEAALSETQRDGLNQWFLTSCVTRAEPGASICLIATRWHRNDLIGFIQREAEQSGEVWSRMRLQAIKPNGSALWQDRWPLEKLLRIKERYMISGYPWMFDALYQQEPPEVMDSEWDPEYFGPHVMFDQWPSDFETSFRVVCLDPSMGATDKSDYQAFVMMLVDKQGTVWIDADINRLDAYAQVGRGLDICRHFHADAFGVEIQGFQGILEPIYVEKAKERGMSHIPVHGIPSTENKRIKIRSEISPFLAQGLLKFRVHSPGVNLLLEQLRGFPGHKYDDGPDALAMGLQLCRHIFQFGPYGPDTADAPGLVRT